MREESTSTALGPGTTLPVVRFESFSVPGVVHGVTTRTPDLPYHGNMSYMVGDDPSLVRRSRSAWAEAIGFDARRLVLGRQVHETAIARVDESHAGSGADGVETAIRGVDGLMTNSASLPIGVMAADCVPILFHDPVVRAVAAVHAGWRGTVDGIATEAIEQMQRAFGSHPGDVNVGLAPAICRSCYQVGVDVVERWNMNPHAAGSGALEKTETGHYFDLRRANYVQLVKSGVRPDNIEVSALCTRCSAGRTFSRRGLGPRTGLFSAIIMLEDEGESLRLER